jgi:ABC-2 type transport system permease protein
VRPSLTGTGSLARFAVRRDRVLVAIWLLVLVSVCYASAAATGSLYATRAEQVDAAEAINGSPAVIALYGPILDVHSLGELAMTKMTVLYAVFVAALAIVLVRRHTRVEEETGQSELLGGTGIGRDAVLAAAVLESALAGLAVGALAALVDIAGGLPVAGSILFGASWTGLGLVATGLAAVACQLSASARTCGAAAAGGIGVLYLLRAVGDTSVSWLSWCTPFGWSTQLRAWSEPRWWVLLLYPALALVLVGLAQVLRKRRDLGSGLVAARPGPATGSARLGDAFALALRLHTTALVTWTVAIGVLGLVLGAIAPNIGDLLDSPSARDLMERIGGKGAMVDTLLAAELSVVAVVVTCFAITVVGHTGADEADGRTEQVLATATSRARTFVATAVVSLGGAAWLLLVAGLAIGIGVGHSTLGAALAQLPAVALVAALATLCGAVRSRWAVLGWGLLVGFLTLGQFGELLRLPGWALDISPYTHTPRMPVEEFQLGPAAMLSAGAAAVLVLAWSQFRRRDIG